MDDGTRVGYEVLLVWRRQELFDPFPQLLYRIPDQEPHHNNQEDHQGSSVLDEGALGKFVEEH